jgi:hypothetical protein
MLLDASGRAMLRDETVIGLDALIVAMLDEGVRCFR